MRELKIKTMKSFCNPKQQQHTTRTCQKYLLFNRDFAKQFREVKKPNGTHTHTKLLSVDRNFHSSN